MTVQRMAALDPQGSPHKSQWRVVGFTLSCEGPASQEELLRRLGDAARSALGTEGPVTLMAALDLAGDPAFEAACLDAGVALSGVTRVGPGAALPMDGSL